MWEIRPRDMNMTDCENTEASSGARGEKPHVYRRFIIRYRNCKTIGRTLNHRSSKNDSEIHQYQKQPSWIRGTLRRERFKVGRFIIDPFWLVTNDEVRPPIVMTSHAWHETPKTRLCEHLPGCFKDNNIPPWRMWCDVTSGNTTSCDWKFNIAGSLCDCDKFCRFLGKLQHFLSKLIFFPRVSG